MARSKIQQVFDFGWDDSFFSYRSSSIQKKTAFSIMQCKSGSLGRNASICPDCGHMEVYNNSCRNRNCPNCQAVHKEIWVDKRRAEVIDSPYFHVVFTLPHELNPLLYCNQKLLYGLLHRCCADTLLELSADKKWLGATPGIIQILHTWNQELNYHVHMHCIVSGGGLTRDGKIRKSSKSFFIRTEVLRDKFKGKFMARLSSLYESGSLAFSPSCETLRNSYEWKEFKNSLYGKDWCPYIKETFNGFGNAIEYLGRYTHKVAISNSRILSVTETETTWYYVKKKYKLNMDFFAESMGSYSAGFRNQVFQIIQSSLNLFTELLNPFYEIFQQITQILVFPNQRLHVFALHPAMPPFLFSFSHLRPAFCFSMHY